MAMHFGESMDLRAPLSLPQNGAMASCIGGLVSTMNPISPAASTSGSQSSLSRRYISNALCRALQASVQLGGEQNSDKSGAEACPTCARPTRRAFLSAAMPTGGTRNIGFQVNVGDRRGQLHELIKAGGKLSSSRRVGVP